MAKKDLPKEEEKAEIIETAETSKEETPIEAVVETPIISNHLERPCYKNEAQLELDSKQSEESL